MRFFMILPFKTNIKMKKLFISTLCFVAAVQFSFAQSNAERNKAIY